jgi:hypothetical protein
MSIRSRISLSAVLLLGLAALVAVSGAADAGAIPKLPKKFSFVERKVEVSASGNLTYRWTYDSREKCSVGYSKTIEEELRFNVPAKRTKLVITAGRMAIPAVFGGTSELDVRLGGWQTTNYCPPAKKAPEPPEPTCKSGSLPVVMLLTSTVADVPLGEDDLAPLGRETQFGLGRTKGFAQNQECARNRREIPFQYDEELGWSADPRAGMAVGMNATTDAYAHLTKGKTLRRQIHITGGCGGASARASATSKIPANITSCTLNGVVTVKVTGLG